MPAYFCEIVDDEENRHWSDVIEGDYSIEILAETAERFAENETSLAGKTLRMYPIDLSTPALQRSAIEV